MLLNGWETINKLLRQFLGLEKSPPAIEQHPEISNRRPNRKPKQYEVQDVIRSFGRDRSILRNIKKMPDREKVKLVRRCYFQGSSVIFQEFIFKISRFCVVRFVCNQITRWFS